MPSDVLHYGPDASQFEHARQLRRQREDEKSHLYHHYPPDYRHEDQHNSIEQVIVTMRYGKNNARVILF